MHLCTWIEIDESLNASCDCRKFAPSPYDKCPASSLREIKLLFHTQETYQIEACDNKDVMRTVPRGIYMPMVLLCGISDGDIMQQFEHNISSQEMRVVEHCWARQGMCGGRSVVLGLFIGTNTGSPFPSSRAKTSCSVLLVLLFAWSRILGHQRA